MAFLPPNQQRQSTEGIRQRQRLSHHIQDDKNLVQIWRKAGAFVTRVQAKESANSKPLFGTHLH